MTDTDDHKTKMQDMQAKQREKVAELAASPPPPSA